MRYVILILWQLELMKIYEISTSVGLLKARVVVLQKAGISLKNYWILFIEKADFFRLENLTVGYNFDLGDTSFIKSARVSLTAQNLFTITDYTGADPEPAFQDLGAVDNGGNTGNPEVLAPGIDRRYNYFQNRTITLGLNVKF